MHAGGPGRPAGRGGGAAVSGHEKGAEESRIADRRRSASPQFRQQRDEALQDPLVRAAAVPPRSLEAARFELVSRLEVGVPGIFALHVPPVGSRPL
jgi:hypothetical protein